MAFLNKKIKALASALIITAMSNVALFINNNLHSDYHMCFVVLY